MNQMQIKFNRIFVLLFFMGSVSFSNTMNAQDIAGYRYTSYTSENGGTWDYNSISNPFTVSYSGGTWITNEVVNYSAGILPASLSNYFEPATMLELGTLVNGTPPSALYTFTSTLPSGTVMFIQDIDGLESFEIQFLDAYGTPLDPISIGTYNLSDPTISTVSFSPTHITATSIDTFNYDEPLNNFVFTSDLVKQIKITQIASRSTVESSGTAEFYFATPNPIILPIVLESFTALKEKDKAKLSWKTLSEINVSSFIIEYSNDGSIFNAIGTIAATGNSSSPVAYSWLHNNPVTGNNYYRLKMVDHDGKFSYSPIGVIKIINNEEPVISVYPNPVHEVLNILLPKMGTTKTLLNVYSSNGRQVYNKPVGKTQTMQLSVNSLASGVYYIRVVENGTVLYNTKFVKQ